LGFQTFTCLADVINKLSVHSFCYLFSGMEPVNNQSDIYEPAEPVEQFWFSNGTDAPIVNPPKSPKSDSR
ncbi:MAG TPA: hypothetical protein VLA19_17060, partial [Herpetosiphonaceae bacterium]|nr:hypothetical protein [Herpetosiphonaceae bacterium]